MPLMWAADGQITVPAVFAAGYSAVTFYGTTAAAITGTAGTTFYTLNLGTTLGAGQSKTIGIGHTTAGSGAHYHGH